MRVSERSVLKSHPSLVKRQNYPCLREICQQFKPALGYHAAAYKHTPLVE
jgi:FlaA1/EpsC-like NDP-sugar epimerase